MDDYKRDLDHLDSEFKSMTDMIKKLVANGDLPLSSFYRVEAHDFRLISLRYWYLKTFSNFKWSDPWQYLASMKDSDRYASIEEMFNKLPPSTKYVYLDNISNKFIKRIKDTFIEYLVDKYGEHGLVDIFESFRLPDGRQLTTNLETRRIYLKLTPKGYHIDDTFVALSVNFNNRDFNWTIKKGDGNITTNNESFNWDEIKFPHGITIGDVLDWREYLHEYYLNKLIAKYDELDMEWWGKADD